MTERDDEILNEAAAIIDAEAQQIADTLVAGARSVVDALGPFMEAMQRAAKAVVAFGECLIDAEAERLVSDAEQITKDADATRGWL